MMLSRSRHLTEFACVVCGRSLKGEQPAGGFAYLAGARPAGSVACAGWCALVAIDRLRRTGRVDRPHRHQHRQEGDL